MEDFIMETKKENEINYELNLKFINSIKKNINDGLACEIKIYPRNEDYSQYIFEEEKNVLLNFSNR